MQSERSTKRERWIKILVVFSSVLISLIIGEIALRYLTVFPVSTSSNRVIDSRVGYKLSSSLPDVDSNGFRNNPDAFEVMEVAAIGDSHTYGNNVVSEFAWPAVFEKNTGLKTYNFGMGGYNIYNYHALFHTALDLKPQGIIIALYPTNDFQLSFSYCRAGGDFEFWHEQVLALRLEAPKNAQECGISADRERANRSQIWPDSAILSAIDYLLVENIKAYAMRSQPIINTSIFINNIKYNLGISGQEGLEDKFFRFPGNVPLVHKERTRKNVEAMQEGIEQTLPNFARLAESWHKNALLHGINFGVVVIPSREQVTYAYLIEGGQIGEVDPQFRELIEAENRAEQMALEVLEQFGIPYVMALEDLVEAMDVALRSGVNFYPAIDSHPLEDGYRAYAEAAERLWRALPRHRR